MQNFVILFEAPDGSGTKAIGQTRAPHTFNRAVAKHDAHDFLSLSYWDKPSSLPVVKAKDMDQYVANLFTP